MFDSTAGLWLAVMASGLYHGVNPGMGWPLAVSAALMEQRSEHRNNAFLRAIAALAVGHFLAIVAILLPFAMMSLLLQWQREIRLVSGTILIVLGLWIFITRRHPRFLARVKPTRLVLWSFLVALAHGAALMLVPVYLGLGYTESSHAGHMPAGTMMTQSLGIALVVAVAHTAAMLAAGGVLGWGVYRWFGLRFLSRGWFDLERIWAASLVLVGVLALATA